MRLCLNVAEPPGELLYANFNQDFTCVNVGYKKYFKIYTFDDIENSGLKCIYTYNKKDIYIVERLFSSSLVAFSTLSYPRRVRLWHIKKNIEICSFDYTSTILNILLNRSRIVVSTDENIYIHNSKDMKLIYTIRDIPSNLNGVCALSSNVDNSYIGFPCSNTVGNLQIFDTIHLKTIKEFQAHKTKLMAVTFNCTATMVATASYKGTVIRVFSLPLCHNIYEFRRGIKRSVNITSLSFSQNSSFLISASDTETIHIFSFDPKSNRKFENTVEPIDSSDKYNRPSFSKIQRRNTIASGTLTYKDSFTRKFKSFLKFGSNLVFSRNMNHLLDQYRDFATVRLPSSGFRNIAAISIEKGNYNIHVISSSGIHYLYRLDPIDGGNCELLQEKRFILTGTNDHYVCQNHCQT